MRLGSIAVMVVVCLACIHCGPMESPSSDAGVDAGLDAGVYAGPGPDARLDAGLDAGSSTRFGQVQLGRDLILSAGLVRVGQHDA
jgi:hypothetical protein